MQDSVVRISPDAARSRSLSKSDACLSIQNINLIITMFSCFNFLTACKLELVAKRDVGENLKV